MYRKLCLLFVLAIQLSFAQSQIEGYVTDANNEPVSYANVFFIGGDKNRYNY